MEKVGRAGRGEVGREKVGIWWGVTVQIQSDPVRRDCSDGIPSSSEPQTDSERLGEQAYQLHCW